MRLDHHIVHTLLPTLALWLPLGLMLTFGAGRAPAKEPEATETVAPRSWHATTVVSARRGYRVINYWSEGANMRAETLISGHPVTTIIRGGRYIVIDELRGIGIDVARSALAVTGDTKRSRPFANELDELMRQGGEKVEDTEAAGLEAELFRLTDTQGRRTVWVSLAPPRVPLRTEVFVRGSGETITTNYTNWAFDLEIPQRFFETPQGTEIERLDYETYVTKSREGPLSLVPVLYPDLLHGGPMR